MTEDRLPHRLTVVWFTDLVGLVRRFQAAVRAAVSADSGRIVKFLGNGALVESPSSSASSASPEQYGDLILEPGQTRPLKAGDYFLPVDEFPRGSDA